MKHILLINKLEQLNINKDSSLQLAITLYSMKKEVFILFTNDLYYINANSKELIVYEFKGNISDNFYVDYFNLENKRNIKLIKGDIIHMRLDPPFDSFYLQALWLLKSFEDVGIKVINSAKAIILNNEKLLAYQQKHSIDTFIGISDEYFLKFCKRLLKNNVKEIVFKPLNLYQGLGVERFNLESCNEKKWLEIFNKYKNKHQGMVIVQPFIPNIVKGEIRSVFFMGNYLGSILKVPKAGDFRSNIVHGANYLTYNLDNIIRDKCINISQKLMEQGLSLLAYDILEDNIQEINITCPGLLVEVSSANNRNLSRDIVDIIDNSIVS